MLPQSATHHLMADDLHSYEAGFQTDYLLVDAVVTSSELRLSDHLNSSAPTVDVRPRFVRQVRTGGLINLDGTCGELAKSSVLFVVPTSEPDRPHGPTNHAWKKTKLRECWIAMGAYVIKGTVHSDVGNDARIAVRSLNKQFMAVTDAVVTDPSGDSQQHSILIVNRNRVDLLVVDDASSGGQRKGVSHR